MTEPETPDAAGALLRWQATGATWVLRGWEGEAAVVDLLTCEAGEVVGRLRSSDPAFVARVSAQEGSSGPP